MWHCWEPGLWKWIGTIKVTLWSSKSGTIWYLLRVLTKQLASNKLKRNANVIFTFGHRRWNPRCKWNTNKRLDVSRSHSYLQGNSIFIDLPPALFVFLYFLLAWAWWDLFSTLEGRLAHLPFVFTANPEWAVRAHSSYQVTEPQPHALLNPHTHEQIKLSQLQHQWGHLLWWSQLLCGTEGPRAQRPNCHGSHTQQRWSELFLAPPTAFFRITM